MLNCGQTVWALAFGPCLSTRVDALHQNRCDPELLLAMGLNNGAIQVWVVSTGKNELWTRFHHQELIGLNINSMGFSTCSVRFNMFKSLFCLQETCGLL